MFDGEARAKGQIEREKGTGRGVGERERGKGGREGASFLKGEREKGGAELSW